MRRQKSYPLSVAKELKKAKPENDLEIFILNLNDTELGLKTENDTNKPGFEL